jgi:hypothetical protein
VLGARPHAHWGREQRGPPQECTRRATRPFSCSRRPTHLRRACGDPTRCSPFYQYIYMQADDELTFAVDGLECKCVSNYRVRVGMNLPSRQRMLITRRVGDDAETTVKRYRDDPATAARFAAAINALRASGVNCAKQFDPVRQIIPSPALPRAAFSHWAYPGMIAHISRRFLQRQW